MTTRELLAELARRGERLVVEDGRLALAPGLVPDELFEAVAAHKEELRPLAEILEAGGIRSGADDRLLRSLLPCYGRMVTIRTGGETWTGRVWGVSRRGLAVRSGLHGLIYGADFGDVVEVEGCFDRRGGSSKSSGK